MKEQTLSASAGALSYATASSLTALSATLMAGSNTVPRYPGMISFLRKGDSGRTLARRDGDTLYALARGSARDRALESVSWLIVSAIAFAAIVLGLVS